jgi:5-methylcytosine-specific restriction endonuclease McrA
MPRIYEKPGKTCLACGNRFASDLPNNKKSVCDSCLLIQTQCPVCGLMMSKWRIKGIVRITCSNRCHSAARSPESRSAAGKKANQTKWANHVYKSHQNDIARGKSEYKEWRLKVFERDNYTCQDCGDHNYSGRGQTMQLHPHHIKPFATFPELRYEVINGVTLCPPCHRKRHKHVFIGHSKRAKNQLRLPIVQ